MIKTRSGIAIKGVTLFFLIYFCVLGVFGLLIWGKYITNISEDGAEMTDTYFLLGLVIATIYYGVIIIWTFRIYQRKEINVTGAVLQLISIFLLGVCSSLYGLYFIYN